MNNSETTRIIIWHKESLIYSILSDVFTVFSLCLLSYFSKGDWFWSAVCFIAWGVYMACFVDIVFSDKIKKFRTNNEAIEYLNSSPK